ncbi:conserved hypothetical protein, partial [Streptomyces sp. SPB78]
TGRGGGRYGPGLVGGPAAPGVPRGAGLRPGIGGGRAGGCGGRRIGGRARVPYVSAPSLVDIVDNVGNADNTDRPTAGHRSRITAPRVPAGVPVRRCVARVSRDGALPGTEGGAAPGSHRRPRAAGLPGLYSWTS